MDEHSLECLDFYRVREVLARHAMTGLGRRLAAAIQPIARRELVERWFRQIHELQERVEEHGMPPFGGITDVRETVENCAPPLHVSVDDVARIGSTLEGTHAISEYLRDVPESHTELQHLVSRIGDFSTIAARIRDVIDSDGQVRDDASPKLARIRNDIRRASDSIHQTVERLLRDNDVKRLLQYSSHTFHNDRLVLPLRAECRGRLPGIVHRTSDSGATIYVEPAAAVEANNEISNLRIAETEEINRLLWDLTHEIYVNSAEIIKTLDALAVLDLIVAKVRFAKTYDARCPELIDDCAIHMRQARHPILLDLAREQADADGKPHEVVAVDYRLGDDFDLLVVTGPNTGGKTVLLKTIGLLSLMVQAGLPVPVAEGSRTGLFSNILIDIGDEQSMQQSLSTFSAHMKRLLDMLKRAALKTLVLIDELGAGTDPDEGAAIGRALLDEFLRLQCRAVVTTHIGALKSFALTRERAENGSVEFDHETLRPTYHLRIGEAGSSNAIEIAQRLGMSRRMVSAARQNLSHRAKALRSALAGAESAKRRAEQARHAAETARTDADRTQAEATKAKVTLEQQQADFQEWVSRVAHLQPGDPVRVRDFDRDGKIVRLRVDQHRAEVDVGSFAVEVALGDILPPQTPAPPPKPARPQPAKPAKPARRERPAGERGKTRPAPKPTPRPPKPQPNVPAMSEKAAAALKPGDRVYAKRFHRQGTVVRVKAQKRLAIIDVGLLEIEVPFDGLADPDAARGAEQPRRQKRGAGKSAPRDGRRTTKPATTEPAARKPESAEQPEKPTPDAGPQKTDPPPAETGPASS